MNEIQDVDITLDIVLSIPAKTTAEAYKKLSEMQTLNLLKAAIEKCELDSRKFKTKH